MVPRSTVHTFTERKSLMYQVVNQLSLSQEFRDLPRSIALWGIGGSGKSQLALRFIEKHGDNYTTIIWIDAQTPEAATRSYSEAFERFNLDYPQHVIDESRNDGSLYDRRGISTANSWVIDTVKEWLENTPCNWLVVIDNADNLTWIHDIMPKGRMGSLIVTSRDRMVYRAVNHAIHVDKMSTEEALDLLLRSANIVPDSRQQDEADPVQKQSHEHQAFRIVDQLGYLALAIDLAGAYISQHDFVQEDLSRYLKFLEQNSVPMLGNKALQDAGDYDHTVATVWETSIAAINKTSPASVDLLAFLAYLSPTPVDDRLFAEASMFIHQRSNEHPTWWFLREALLSVVIILLPGIIVQLIFGEFILPRKPNLQGRFRIQSWSPIMLIPSALDFITTVPLVMKIHERLNGNFMIKDHAVWSSEAIVKGLCAGLSSSILTQFTVLYDKKGFLFATIMLRLHYVMGVLLNGSDGFEWYRTNLDQQVALHSWRLLDQLGFSHINKAQILTVGRSVLTAPRESQIMATGIFFLSAAFLILIFSSLGRKNILGVTIPEPYEIIVLASGFVFLWPLFWHPWDEEPHLFRVSPVLVNSLLKVTSDGQWNRQMYSEVMVPLTRFSLIQREAGSAYSMHVLVRWWARNRLPIEEQQAWAWEICRFLFMSQKSPTCWEDPLCQQMLIPHLVDIATSKSGNDLSQILEWIDITLTIVGKSHGILPDD